MSATAKTAAESAVVLDAPTFRSVPTPALNLHDIEAVRREMARVYKDMRSMKIDGGDGSRLIYALSQIGKLIEASTFERRLEALEHNPSRRLGQPDAVEDLEVIANGQDPA
jgi:hypothetical protein